MTDEDLKKANSLKADIKELEHFMWSAERLWTGKIIKIDTKYIFKVNAYGALPSAEYELNKNMKNTILDVLSEHLKTMRKQLADM